MSVGIKKLALSFAAAGIIWSTAGTALGLGGILSTKHNLSVSGSGDIKATQEERVCIFCHTPHHASPVTPLWSRPTSSTVYDLYWSSTLTAKPGQPSGASRLCLSCHDGTVALGAQYGSSPTSNVIQMAGGITTLPSSRGTNLGKDLSNDHPISFAYTVDLAQQNGQLKAPSELPALIRLEQGGLLQCTACHNPHRNPYGSFLVMDNTKSALCVSCHSITGWGLSGMANAATTKAAGCGICHLSHNGNKPQRLLKKKEEEQNCLPCHQSGGNGPDIQSELQKLYTHPVASYTGVHDEAEDPAKMLKHVECEDCHNPHQANTAPALAPAVNGSLAGVKGIIATIWSQTSPSSYEYEICFRCHADHSVTLTQTPQTIVRRIQQTNLRLNFSDLNPSFHPVVAQGKGTNVPSLRSKILVGGVLVTGYSTASMIYCSDCHSSDDSVKAGGTAPNGPHGSNYPHILMARYETTYPVTYQKSCYDLCFRCHDDAVLLDPAQSAFPKHSLHVIDNSIPCYVCHDSHGVSSADGATPNANAHLINFDTGVVKTGSYNATARTCDVSCHSTTHLPY
jgi:predicted CXXCH cytochrome family protein